MAIISHQAMTGPTQKQSQHHGGQRMCDGSELWNDLIQTREWMVIDRPCSLSEYNSPAELGNLFISGSLKVKVLVTQLCPTLCNPMNCSLPSSSVQGILQARILGWVAILFSRGSSWPRDWTWMSCIADRFFTVWTTKEVLSLERLTLSNVVSEYY